MSTFDGKKILLCDDEPDVTELLEYKLDQAGYRVMVVNNPLLFMSTARDFLPEMIILDVMMPDLDGFQVCRMLKADSVLNNVPVLFLTAKGESEDRIKGLEIGADDYLAKPFDSRELLLRIASVFKRLSRQESQVPTILKIGALEINVAEHFAKVDGKEIELTATEFKLLQLLVERKGRVQTRENLLINVWNYDSDIETRTVDTHVRRLREKLGKHAHLIETIRGVGYKMIDKAQ